MCYYIPLSPYYLGGYFEYFLFMVPALILVLAAQLLVSSRYKKYGGIATSGQVTGQEIAQKILSDHGVTDVSVSMVQGKMTDHYHPGQKVIYLSEGVYDSTSVAAVSIAAHEAGHALQHAKGYAFLQFRSAMVPVCNIATSLSIPMLILGSVLNSFNLVIIGLMMFGASTLFHLVTLPVEFNASHRAIAYIRSCGRFTEEDAAGAKKMLTAAALTYVAALAQSLLQLLFYILRFAGGRRR